ncbi:MAG: OmpA family protein, partial [Bacteroidota bacterium]|nr:OmpA family protein [Bacteroidota bacterium]
KRMKEYQKAKEYLSYYAQNQKKTKYKLRKQECEKEIRNIDFILHSLENPVPFSPINLGGNINDSLYQYLPTLTMDNILYFTERKDNKEDFYFSEFEYLGKNLFSVSKKQPLPPPLNTQSNEGAASISPDGRFLYFAKCNAEDGFGSCDIYVSERNGNAWSKPKNLGENVNSSAWDSQPSIASDGRTLFFVSNREGGFGQGDIYYSYLKKDGTWTKAKNLGAKVNTSGMEMTPFIHPSNTTLYFSSDGHTGMGGQDIFFSKIENGKFSSPINLGYPINTEADETCFFVNSEGTLGFFASNSLEKNFGNMDIYAFELYSEIQPTKVITLKGKIIYDDMKKGNHALLEIKNLSTNRIVAATYSDKVTDNFLLALPIEEDYALSVTCEGYLFFSENFSLKNYNDTSFVKQENITLHSIKEGESIVLKNIFFATDSFELKEESTAELETILELMQKNPNIKIEISGHTDNVGKEDYNLTLSNNRAKSVKQWLVSKGVEETRIISRGYGTSKPIANNNTAEGREQNRRTEFKILSK